MEAQQGRKGGLSETVREEVLDRKQLVQEPWGRKDVCKGLAARSVL